ncbi:MAG TPA: hypothetical protein VGJ60_16625 [Chloroflexota bacterium]|jgi:hypothetical protein
MSVAVPGATRNAEKAWQIFKHYHPATAEDAHATALALYDRGYRDCLADVTDFAGLHAAIHRLADLLEATQREREAIQVLDELAEAQRRLQEGA